MTAQHAERRGGLERRPSGEQLERDAAEAVQVRSRIDRIPARPLRAHVRDRSAHHPARAGVVGAGREPEVHQLDAPRPRGIDPGDQVRRLHVAVNESASMEIGERLAGLREVRDHDRRVGGTAARLAVQRFSLDQLHGEEGEAATLGTERRAPEVVHLGQVRVGQLRERPEFLLEVAQRRLGELARRQHL